MEERTQFQAEIERLVRSHALHGSESLCKLLRYLGRHALEHPGVPVKEYQIATEVFGRQADFDPQLDSMVRVQAGRLRSKLAEYYSTEGVGDRLIIELPKGSYVINFHERSGSGAIPGNGAAAVNHNYLPADAPQQTKKNTLTVVVLATGLALALLATGWLLWNRREAAVSSAGLPVEAPAASPVQIFWRAFVSGPEEPWVIFSNAQFIGRPDKGMRYYDSAKDGNAAILDHYTGVGEVLAVHNLDLVFSALHRSLRIKRGSLFSLDDAKNNDLIFIGSPGENLTLLEIPSTKYFTFRRMQEEPHAGKMEIINVKPQPQEAASYIASPSNVPLTEDYAVVALVKAINPEHYELILAGTTTIGTQAAAEYVTRENYLNELLSRMNVTKSAEMKPFEAVIQVKVAKGVPVESSLVALRVLN